MIHTHTLLRLMKDFPLKAILIGLVVVTLGAPSVLPAKGLASGVYDLGYGYKKPITEEKKQHFKLIVSEVFDTFKDVVASYNAKANIIFHWDSSGTGAFTLQREGGRVWDFYVYDGILRVPNITDDAVQLVICHELGHHIAGYPLKSGSSWSAAEGQADYFATFACAPKVWEADEEKNELFRDLVQPFFKSQCDESFSRQARRDICYRTAVAMEAMRYYEGYSKGVLPSLYDKDETLVEKTNTSHPNAQCRVDTQLAGAFCSKEFDHFYIPGRSGNNTIDDEIDSNKYYCNQYEQQNVARPRCWYAPQL